MDFSFLRNGYEATTGKRTSITFPSGKVQQLSYGNDGRIQSTSYNNDVVVSGIQWTYSGMIKEWTWAQATGWSGIHSKVEFSYDLDGRPSQIKDLDQRNLVWDNGNRLVGVSDIQNNDVEQTYGYDGLDRLTQTDVGIWNGGITFGYDANSNRTSLTDIFSGTSLNYIYGVNNNRFMNQQATGGVAVTSIYDDMGNLIQDGIGLELKYDVMGRLVEAIKGPQHIKSSYNALGERVSKKNILTNEIFIYTKDEEGRPLGTYIVDTSAANGFKVKEEYLHLNDWRPIAVVRPDNNVGMNQPQIYPILTDHLGTPRKILDGSTGQTRWAWDAKQPFGHELPNETPTTGFAAFTFDLRFAGQIYDIETGLFHNGFRDYHPGLGRYIQSDPIGLDGGWNTYGYVGGNPLSGIDPLGLKISETSDTPETRDAFRYLLKSNSANITIQKTVNSNRTLNIVIVKGFGSVYRDKHQTIYWNPEIGFCDTTTGMYMTPAMVLLHEIGHFLQREEFPAFNNVSIYPINSWNRENWKNVRKKFTIRYYEQPASKDLGELVRNSHGNGNLVEQNILMYKFNKVNGQPVSKLKTELQRIPL